MNIYKLLEMCTEKNASDLHITVGIPPTARINGRLVHVPDEPVAQPSDVEAVVRTLLSEEQITTLEANGEIDLSISIPSYSRFRMNAYKQRGSYAIALRMINSRILTPKELGLPDVVSTFAYKKRGLVLVTGPTGSGKSTTLASIIDIINKDRECHIITLEDPIEYLHKHKKAMVNQREIGHDTRSYTNALRAALRQDPDVILVGEMRDLDSIAIALSAAETGHLVFSTLHTIGAAKTIDRVVDVFPPYQQQQVRVQLSTVIEGVISQQLLPLKDGGGRVAAFEIMVATPAIRNLIRESKTPQIYNIIATSAQAGMLTMDNCLLSLMHEGRITRDIALTYCVDLDYMRQAMRISN